MAFYDYRESKADVQANGGGWSFYANVRYTNHKTGNVYSADNTYVKAAIDHGYGGLNLEAYDIPHADDVYVGWSTNFNKWTFANGVLTIEGDGPKGRYTIVVA